MSDRLFFKPYLVMVMILMILRSFLVRWILLTLRPWELNLLIKLGTESLGYPVIPVGSTKCPV